MPELRRRTVGRFGMPGRLLLLPIFWVVVGNGAAAEQQPQPQPQTVPIYVVAVASEPVGQRSTDAVERAAIEAMQGMAPFAVVQPPVIPETLPPNPDLALVEDSRTVEETLQSGLQAMMSLDLDGAKSRFAQIVALYEEKPALTLITGGRPLAQALVNLAVVAYLEGDTARTEEYLRFSVSVDPTQMPDPELFPDVAELYAAVADDVGSRPLVRVEIATVPAGAEVFVDGMRRGTAPNRWELPPGRHVFAARMDGYVSTGAIVDVQPRRRGAPVQVELALEELPGGAAPPVGRPEPAGVSELPVALMEGTGRELGLFRGICDEVGARLLLVLWIMPGDGTRSMISAQVYDRQVERVIASALPVEVLLDPFTIGASAAPAIRQVLNTTAESLLPVVPPLPIDLVGDTTPTDVQPTGGTGETEDKPILSSWWFWTIVGAAAAVVVGSTATGIYFGVTAGEEPRGPDNPQIILEF